MAKEKRRRVSKVFTRIERWAKEFGLPIRTKPTLDIPKEEAELALHLIDEELNETYQALKDKNIHEVQDGLADLLWVVVRAMHTFGIDPEYSNKEVFDSNMSKLCKTRNEAVQTIEAYKKGTHPSKPNQKINCYFEETVNNMFIIKRAKDNKVMKSINFVEPNFS